MSVVASLMSGGVRDGVFPYGEWTLFDRNGIVEEGATDGSGGRWLCLPCSVPSGQRRHGPCREQASSLHASVRRDDNPQVYGIVVASFDKLECRTQQGAKGRTNIPSSSIDHGYNSMHA